MSAVHSYTQVSKKEKAAIVGQKLLKGAPALVHRSLDDLLKMLPVAAQWRGQEIMFSVGRCQEGFDCYAWETENAYVVTDTREGFDVRFISEDPKQAIAMMICWLRTEGIL